MTVEKYRITTLSISEIAKELDVKEDYPVRYVKSHMIVFKCRAPYTVFALYVVGNYLFDRVVNCF